MEESCLVGEARNGSREAFRELMRMHQSRVRAYVSRHIHDRDALDDLAQITFIAAYRSLDSYKPEVPFAIWLVRIARNRVLTHLRDEQLRRRHERESFARSFINASIEWAETEDSAGTSPDAELKALRGCMEKLPPHSAGLLREHYFKGRKAAQIAESTGKGKSGVTMALLRIRHVLRECIESNRVVAEAGQ